jgi:hypothetical protein
MQTTTNKCGHQLKITTEQRETETICKCLLYYKKSNNYHNLFTFYKKSLNAYTSIYIASLLLLRCILFRIHNGQPESDLLLNPKF